MESNIQESVHRGTLIKEI